MKKLSVCMLAVILALSVMAQPQNPRAVVAATKMNVVYAGLVNPISIAVPEVSDDDLLVSVSSGTITRTGPGEYDLNCGSGVNEITISVSCKSGSTTTPVGTYSFRVKNVPDPIIVFSGKKGGVLTKESIIANPFLIAVLENFLFDGIAFNVVSYTFATTQGDKNIEQTCKGNRLDAQALELIKNLESGTKFSLESIKVVGPDGIERQLPSCYFKIL
ncbi:MAG: hypothetical protein KKA07_17485 [Bacteroidetes bacterium]|nr:hypothetical protein [Bacteroidota bacterium]MBU1720863.1 hypothetical protein [Bacteroidota bacterium]